MDQELARLIARRAGADRGATADELDSGYVESARRHNAKVRERNRWGWVRFFDRMAASHAALAEGHRERAEKLLEGA